MSIVTLFDKSYNTLETDYKAENIALNLLMYYKEIDNIIIKRQGNNKRSFNKDVIKIYQEYFGIDESAMVLETYRDGIYDYLPEGFFYKPTLGVAFDDIENVIKKFQAQKEIEKNARKFFLPYELETFYSEIKALKIENNFNASYQHDNLSVSISKLWPLINELEPSMGKIFVFLLPYFHSTRGNIIWLEKCLIAFLKIKVKITFIDNVINNKNFSLENISENILGISTVLTGDYKDGLRSWCINYGPIQYEVLNNYVPETNLRKLLNKIYDYCIPLNINIVENFITDKHENAFILSNQDNTSLLGLSTFI
jgi:hypothetical protein